MMRWMAFLFGMTLLSITGMVVFARQPAGEDTSFIAFVSASEDAKPGLYIMNADGSDRRLMVSGRRYAASPTWSPDGAWIAFELDYMVHRIRLDGSHLQRLTPDFPGLKPAWSPDGAWIAFVSPLDGDSEVYRMRPDGSEVQQLTHNERVRDTMPAWSPDGDSILFISDREGASGVFRMRPDGSQQERLVAAEMDAFLNPIWSRDGEWIVFTIWRGLHSRLYRVPADFSQPPQRLLENTGERFFYVLGSGFSFDGVWLTFQANEVGSVNQIYKAHFDGSEVIQLTGGTSRNQSPAWSPRVDLPWRLWVNAAAGLALLGAGIAPGSLFRDLRLRQ